MHCHYFENINRHTKNEPRFRLITRQALQDHRKALHDYFYNDFCNENVFIKEAVKSVRGHFYSNSQINMVTALNSNGNFNEDAVNKIRARLRISQTMNVDTTKEVDLQANDNQCLKDRNNNDNYPRTPLGNIPHPHYLSRRIFPEHERCESRQYLTNLHDGKMISLKTARLRSTSNNAVKNHLIIPMINKNQSQDEKRSIKNNYEQKEVKRDKTIEISKKASLVSMYTGSQKYTKHKKDEVENKSRSTRYKRYQKVVSSLQCNLVTKSTDEDKYSSLFPEYFNPTKSQISKIMLRESRSKKKYKVRLKWRQAEWIKRHRIRRFKTIMDCVKEINGRLKPTKGDLSKERKVTKCGNTRHHSTEDIVHYSTFLNHTIMAFDPLRLEFAVKRVSEGQKSRSCTSLRNIIRCPTIVRTHFIWDTFAISEMRLERTNTRLQLAPLINVVKILESINELSVCDCKFVTMKPLIHQHSWYENLSKLIRRKLKIINPNVLCRNHPFENSWDEISDSNSSTSKYSLSTKDYNNLSCDSLCNTDDVYGSEPGTTNTGNFSDIEMEVDLDLLLATASQLEHVIFACENSTEKCKIHKKLEQKFHNLIQELNLANSTIAEFSAAARIIGSTRFRRTLLQNFQTLRLGEDWAQILSVNGRSLSLEISQCLYELIGDESLNVYFESSEPYMIVNHVYVIVSYAFGMKTQRFIFDQKNICVESDKIVYYSTVELNPLTSYLQ